jgi:hypothetical protein
MKKLVVNAWEFIFNADVSPLRHISDVSTRHYVLQVLGAMWVLAVSVAFGSYTFFAFNLIGHVVLIGAAAITIATYTTATIKPSVFGTGSGRRADGEHE